MADPNGNHHPIPDSMGDLAALWILHLFDPNLLLPRQLALDGIQHLLLDGRLLTISDLRHTAES